MASPEHPTEDAWEALATGETSPETRKEVMLHVVECQACARKWRAIRHLAREARVFDPDVPEGAPTEKSGAHAVPFVRTRRALLVGGTLLAAAAVLLLVMQFRTTGTGDDDGDATVRGDGVARVELGTASATRLEWRAFAGAEVYTVDVFTLDGRPQWRRSAIAGTSVAIEPALAGGVEYRWQVEAVANGVRIAVSRPGRFTVAR